MITQFRFSFKVIDKLTGEEPDLEEIALEDWAKRLTLEEFAVGENGRLYLLDKCGNFVYAPPDRFILKIELCQKHILLPE